MHTCSRCKLTKSSSSFNKNARYRSGLQSYCKECYLQYGRAQRYGMTPDDFTRMFDAAQGLCATCSTPLNKKGSGTHVDHCHVGGQVRGLLCRGCNTALGAVKDDTETLGRMIDYLDHHAAVVN